MPVVAPATLMPEVLVELSGKGCGCVLVASADGQLEGIFTDGDLRRTLQQVRCVGAGAGSTWQAWRGRAGAALLLV